MLRERYYEAHDLEEGVDREGDLRLLRPLQPAALRQHLAAADPGRSASADLDPGGGSIGDAGAGAPMGRLLGLPVVLRLQGRAHDHAGLLERIWPSSAGSQPPPRQASRSSSAWPRAASRHSISTPSPPSTSDRCLRRSALRDAARLRPKRPSAPASSMVADQCRQPGDQGGARRRRPT